jgi:aconitase A
VVAYALAGSMHVDITREPLGTGTDGQPVYLKDLWPSSAEIAAVIRQVISREMFRARYSDVFTGMSAGATSRSAAASRTNGRIPRPTCRTRPTSAT